jgi:hypothetical protein
MGCTLRNNNEKSSRWRNWRRREQHTLVEAKYDEKLSRWRNLRRREQRALVETGVKNEGVQNYSVRYKGYNLIGVTTVERGDGSYDSTSLFLCIRWLL